MDENLLRIRHSVSHVMAQAVQRTIDPEVKLGFGPALETGFYYDFLFSEDNRFTEEKLKDVEKEMEKIIKESQDFFYIDCEFSQAEEIMQELNQKYKLETIQDLKDNGYLKVRLYLNSVPSEKKEKVTKEVQEEYVSDYNKVTELVKKYFDLGEIFITFVDICEGPHLENTQEIDKKAFSLSSIAGAYRKGDENNDMMTRVYGYAFANKEELKDYMKFLEDAKKRDHRRLGKQLDLFCFSELVGGGLPLFTPKGTILKELLQKQVENLCEKFGFQKVITPHIAKIDLYQVSGHATKFSDELFHVTSNKDHEFVMKPVQCPHQTQIYKSKTRSYKELPIRYMETEKQYRAEKSGEVGGLSRVYAITVEDGHSFCTIDQIKQEVINMVNIIKEFYEPLGLRGKHWVSLSLRDYSDFSNYIGTEEDWDKAEKMLEEISEEMGLGAVKCEGEAALYGPKLDFMFQDALGREVQIPTVQLDFATPKKFDLTYVNEEGNEENPVMLHRAILGSYERLMMLLIEHFAGTFPLWLAPTQATVISVSEKYNDYAEEVYSQLKDNGMRVEMDNTEHSLGKKIKNAEKMHINYILVVGEDEKKNGEVAVRNYKTKEQYNEKLEEFINSLKKEIEEKNV